MLDFNKAPRLDDKQGIEFETIRQATLFRLEDICCHLYPNGSRRGKEFLVGDISGSPGKSLSINLNKGVWKDFASQDGGSDLVSLWAAKYRIPYGEAAKAMGGYLNLQGARKVAPVLDEKVTLPPPTKVWMYHNAEGKVVATHTRYDLPNGKKEFRPYDALTGKSTFPTPRPLYNLPAVIGAQTVVVVEGEKCADALNTLGYCATTSMGGANAAERADWSTLKGKAVVIWPDNDPAGADYARKVERILRGVATQVRILAPPTDKPAKWDAADAVAEGYEVAGFIHPRGRRLANWTADVYQGKPPARRWLVKNTIPMAAVTMFAAAGDSGKGMLTLDLGVKVTGNDGGMVNTPFSFGNEIVEHGAVVILTAEDDKDEVHRRLHNVAPHGVDNASRLMVVPLPNAGGPMPLIIPGPLGPIASEEYHHLKEELCTIPDLCLVVIDPLASFVHVDVNADPAAGAFATGLLSSLATETGAAVVVCHHMSKGGLDKAGGAEQARSRIRGTTALVDGVRAAYALWAAKTSVAKVVCGKLNLTWATNKVFEGALVKSNGPGDRDVKVFVRNDTGLLEVKNLEIDSASIPYRDLLDMLQGDIATAADSGRPFTSTGINGVYERREELSIGLKTTSKRELEKMVKDLLLEERVFKSAADKQTTQKWLDVEGGPFTRGEGWFEPGFKNIPTKKQLRGNGNVPF